MEKRLLAIDYGEKRIGLALSDLMQMFAKPYETFPNLSLENTLKHLNEIIAAKQVGLVIVGIPWNLDGTESAKTKETQEFLACMQKKLSVPVIGSDERYTTSDANELLKEMGLNWKEARKVIDAMAACLILKRYMERKSN
jgi:putative holliday junction resolvase